jgi:hypothetical protein
MWLRWCPALFRTGDYVVIVQLLVLANLLGGFAMFAFMKPPRHARIEK